MVARYATLLTQHHPHPVRYTANKLSAMRHALYFFLLFCTLFSGLSAQDMAQEEGIIFLRNPSFEDMPRNSSPPLGWTNCGFPGETPPDVHPDPKFEFNVSKEAFHGKTYLGMVTRENETYESVGQQLTEPLVSGHCYRFRLHLARSSVYLSRSRVTGAPSNYVKPIRLRVFGGYSICDRGKLIGTTGLVKNYDWKQYSIKLRPDADYTHIILEAYYPPQTLFPENGNLILDNTQPLVPIACDADPEAPDPLTDDPALYTKTNPEDRIIPTPVRPRNRPPTGQEPVAKAPTPVVPKDRLGTTEGAIIEGQVFAIEDINFKADSPELEPGSEKALQEIVGFLQRNNNVIVEIGGHASRRADAGYAADLSKDRAQSVVDYLKTHSISFRRLLPHGYGNSKPVCMEDAPDCHRRNQRVEVKILKIKKSR